MFKSRPLFLLVITLCLVLVVVMSYWLALLPQRALRNLRAEMLESSGYSLDAKTAHLDVGNGLGVVLQDVTISNTNAPALQLSAASISLPGLFGDATVVDQAIVDVDVSMLAGAGLVLPKNLTLSDGVLKLRDSKSKSLVAITDINGRLFSDSSEGFQAQLALVWNNHVSDLSLSIEDTQRFADTGSPMDLTLKSKDKVLAFSGQGRMDSGLTLAGQATAAATDVGAFTRWLGLPLQTLDGAGKFSLQSGVITEGLTLTFGTVVGDIAGSGVKGQLTLAAGPDRPQLSGQLDVGVISLWGPKTTSSILAQAWSQTPLPIADVSVAEFDLKVKAEQLLLRGQDFGPVTTQLKTNVDTVSLIIPEQSIAGGTGRVNIDFSRRPNGLNLKTTLDFKASDATTVLGGFLGFEALAGAVDWKAQVEANGVSVAELISTLQGDARLASENATLQGIDFAKLLASAHTGWNSKQSVQTEKLRFDVSMTLAEGEAQLNASKVGAVDIALSPQGTIDLLRQAFDVQLAPRSKAINPKLTLQGPWLDPVFTIAPPAKESSAVTPPAN